MSDADFLSADWRPEHCNPENWEKPSTHGIPGVELVGDPHMKLWSETKSWKNPGRKNFKQSTVIHLSDKIATEGIIPSRVIYYDVDTDETNNGGHRRGASEIRNIPGWMHQGVNVLKMSWQRFVLQMPLIMSKVCLTVNRLKMILRKEYVLL